MRSHLPDSTAGRVDEEPQYLRPPADVTCRMGARDVPGTVYRASCEKVEYR